MGGRGEAGSTGGAAAGTGTGVSGEDSRPAEGTSPGRLGAGPADGSAPQDAAYDSVQARAEVDVDWTTDEHDATTPASD